MLEAYKDLLAGIAGILTIGQMFSGVFLCRDIYKAGSTKSVPSGPFLGGFVISILFMQHGILLQDKAIGMVNFVGIAINISYLLFYTFYTPSEERGSLAKHFSIGLGVLAVLLGYAQVEDPSVAPMRFGIIVTAMLFLLISAPLFSIRTIIKTRNTDSIPFPMVVSGLVVGVSWLLYGVAAHQDFVVYQNLLMLTLSIPQLILCLIYPSQRKEKAN